jgi:hypothetical protein
MPCGWCERLTRDDDDALTIVGSLDLVSQTRLGHVSALSGGHGTMRPCRRETPFGGRVSGCTRRLPVGC